MDSGPLKPLQSMGGFPLSVCIWVKLQAIMLGKAVPSGSVTTCLHQDLADTCSHQSPLRIVHSPSAVSIAPHMNFPLMSQLPFLTCTSCLWCGNY